MRSMSCATGSIPTAVLASLAPAPQVLALALHEFATSLHCPPSGELHPSCTRRSAAAACRRPSCYRPAPPPALAARCWSRAVATSRRAARPRRQPPLAALCSGTPPPPALRAVPAQSPWHRSNSRDPSRGADCLPSNVGSQPPVAASRPSAWGSLAGGTPGCQFGCSTACSCGGARSRPPPPSAVARAPPSAPRTSCARLCTDLRSRRAASPPAPATGRLGRRSR
mmetsp:Transcript_38976/g.74645  ORF Transcript_38976/g.74645 Transcript_38976/m.74645 type:complete len:225 (-) Transcript_38976:685-1359(-)